MNGLSAKEEDEEVRIGINFSSVDLFLTAKKTTVCVGTETRKVGIEWKRNRNRLSVYDHRIVRLIVDLP